MKKKSKILLLLLGGLVVVIIVVANIVGSSKDVTEVDVEKVSILNLTEEVSASGYIQPVTKVNITSQVTAEIISIPVKEGQSVAKGQTLVQLDTVQLQKNYDQAKFSYDEIRSRTEAARSVFLQSEEECGRQKELFEKNLISETQYETAEYTCQNYKYTYEAMVSQTKQAQARFEQALDNLKKTTILSPISGIITYLNAEVGEIAAAQTPYSQGITLMIISNLSAFEAEVDVDETEITKILLGQPAKIEVDAFPDTTFNGEVVEIGNTAVTSTRSSNEMATNFKVKVLFKDENPNIRPGMSATVDIITNSKDDVLAVPFGSIVMRELDADSLEKARGMNPNPVENSDSAETVSSEDSSSAEKEEKNLKEYKGVFITKENKAKFIPVETGIADQKNIEIIAGLTENDTVITGPYRMLRSIKHDEDIQIRKK